MNRLRTAPLRRQTLLLAAALLLLGQAVLGPAAMARSWSSGASFLPSGLPICHASVPDHTGNGVPPGQHERDKDCTLCVVCHTLGAATVLSGPAASALAPPAALISRPALRRPARAPPRLLFLAAAYPTGPPLLA